MDLISKLILAGGTFIFLFFIFRPLESVFAAKKDQGFFRPGFITDVFYFLGQYLFWGGLVTSFLFYILMHHLANFYPYIYVKKLLLNHLLSKLLKSLF